MCRCARSEDNAFEKGPDGVAHSTQRLYCDTNVAQPSEPLVQSAGVGKTSRGTFLSDSPVLLSYRDAS